MSLLSRVRPFPPQYRPPARLCPLGNSPAKRAISSSITNENPYPPSPLVLARLRDACAADLRLYPDPDAWAVRRKLGEVFAIAPQQIMVGNGSDELLNVIIRSFASEGDKIAYPHPTYGYYKPLIDIQGAEAVPVEFGEDFALPEGLAVPRGPHHFSRQSQCALGHPRALRRDCRALCAG